MTRDEKILRLLGLAAKAGRLIAGADKVADAARNGMISKNGGVIIVASNAAARTKKNIALAAGDYGIKWAEIGADMLVISSRTGVKGAASAVAVIDRNLASAIAGLAADETGYKTDGNKTFNNKTGEKSGGARNNINNENIKYDKINKK